MLAEDVCVPAKKHLIIPGKVAGGMVEAWSGSCLLRRIIAEARVLVAGLVLRQFTVYGTRRDELVARRA